MRGRGMLYAAYLHHVRGSARVELMGKVVDGSVMVFLGWMGVEGVAELGKWTDDKPSADYEPLGLFMGGTPQ